MADKRLDHATQTETVGHEWDGIEELDTPLPRWWLWTFYATIVFALGYVVVYPALPGISQASEGLFGWSSRGDLARDLESQRRERSAIVAELAVTDIAKLPGKPALMNAAVAGGAAAFKVNCVQCHGSGAAGSKGYPNLNDDDWLWGGDLDAIYTTLKHGIRQPGDGETHMSLMPAFGRDGLLDARQVDAVADYVLALQGTGRASEKGAAIFADNCAVCHGHAGKGLREFGAPNLADAVALYGNDNASILGQINAPRHGVMPSWQGRLDDVTIKMLAAYVHSLGGGEGNPEVLSAAAPEAAATDGTAD